MKRKNKFDAETAGPLRLENFGDVMTFDEVKAYLRIGSTKLCEEVKNGNIVSFRIGAGRKFRRCDVEAYINGRLS